MEYCTSVSQRTHRRQIKNRMVKIKAAEAEISWLLARSMCHIPKNAGPYISHNATCSQSSKNSHLSNSTPPFYNTGFFVPSKPKLRQPWWPHYDITGVTSYFLRIDCACCVQWRMFMCADRCVSVWSAGTHRVSVIWSGPAFSLHVERRICHFSFPASSLLAPSLSSTCLSRLQLIPRQTKRRVAPVTCSLSHSVIKCCVKHGKPLVADYQADAVEEAGSELDQSHCGVILPSVLGMWGSELRPPNFNYCSQWLTH